MLRRSNVSSPYLPNVLVGHATRTAAGWLILRRMYTRELLFRDSGLLVTSRILLAFV